MPRKNFKYRLIYSPRQYITNCMKKDSSHLELVIKNKILYNLAMEIVVLITLHHKVALAAYLWTKTGLWLHTCIPVTV